MKETLKEILKELQYQTKLMEEIYERKDAHKGNNEMLKKQMASMQKIIKSTPGLNPEMAQVLNSIFNAMPGGEPE